MRWSSRSSLVILFLYFLHILPCLGNELQELIDSIRIGDLISSQKILQIQPDLVNATEIHFNTTALIAAAENNYIEIVQYLLMEFSANPNIRDPVYNETALFKASFKGFHNIAHELLKHGADPKLQIKNNETCLMWACFKGHSQIAELLIYYGADVNVQDSKYGFSPLMVAARNGHVETVELLLYAGAEITLQDKKNNTALMLAESNKHESIVNILKEVVLNNGITTSELR